MSYLDFPRLHFGGLFYTNPNTINNTTQNFTPNVNLEQPPPAPPNQYNMRDDGTPGDAGWNPLGVAQWWLEECTVLSAVGRDGAQVGTSDPVIGALVQSPSPKTPMSDGQGGYYDIAKMVDLDPDQQGRSAIYGLRLSVTLPNGAGFQGLLTVPELRQLNPRIAGAQGSWGAVGNWMGTLQKVKWSGDISGSTLLTALRAASAQGLNVKLTVDLHQNNPKNIFTAGDIFCYGRVHGSVGPALAGELAQVVPGRCLQKYSQHGGAKLTAAAARPAGRVVQGRERVVAQTQALGTQRAASNLTAKAVAASSHPPDPWNPAFAVVRQVNSQSFLSIDIGGSILLNASPAHHPTTSDGTFEVNSGISVGVLDQASNKFVAFKNGGINITPQYQALNSGSKNCKLVKNGGVFTIPLTSSDGNAYKTNPLAIQVNGTTVALENKSGLWADVSVSSQRIECGGGQQGQAQLMVRVFGNPPPAGTAPPLSVDVELVDWSQGPQPPNLTPSTDVGVSIGKTDASGVAAVTTKINVPDVTLAAVRQPLDSQVYYVALNDSSGNAVGDGSATLSVLLWKAFQAPSNPTWNDVGPIFAAYARLYPGMKSRLDISDETTVVGFATAVLGHMNTSVADPAYMPVTRDLSPSKMAMIVSWLKQVSQQQSSQPQSSTDSQSGGES
jgi:hypothetical protein